MLDTSWWWQAAGGPGPDPGLIGNSLRFRGSENLTRSFSGSSSGSGQVWTLSMWLKDSLKNTDRAAFAAGNGGEFYNGLNFAAGNSLGLWSYVKNNGQRPFFECGDRFRDPNAWYHFVIRTETTNGNGALRDRFYINGVEYTNFPTWRNESSQNQGLPWMGSTVTHYIGSSYNNQQPWRGYMAEVHCCDGQSLGPENFGEFNDDGVWVPIIPNGLTYGNWGFHLDFSDASNIGADRSGNGNNFTANGFDLTNTTEPNYDWSNDTPTRFSGLLDVLSAGPNNSNPYSSTIYNANQEINYNRSNGDYYQTANQVIPREGRWYWQFRCVGTSSGTGYVGMSEQNWRWNTSPAVRYGSQGSISNSPDNPGSGSGGASWAAGDTIGCAWDADAQTMQFFRNGVAQGSTIQPTDTSGLDFTPVLHSSSNSWQFALNMGSRPSMGGNPPDGFEWLSTATMPDVAVPDPRTRFQVVNYAGNNTARTIDLGFRPGLVWTKAYDINGADHAWMDPLRGTGVWISSNRVDPFVNQTSGITNFGDTGYTLGADNTGGPAGNFNQNGRNYNAYVWAAEEDFTPNITGGGASNISGRRSVDAGFSVLSFDLTSSNTNYTIDHGLNVAPDFVIHKKITSNTNWFCQHRYQQNAGTYFLNTTSNGDPSSNVWRQRFPSATSIFMNTNSSDTMGQCIVYCFAPIPGFSAMGNFRANNSTDGPILITGMRPRFIMFKITDANGGWFMYDTAQPFGVFNPATNPLQANDVNSNANWWNAYDIDILSNGFKMRTSQGDINPNTNNIVWIAFAEHPFGGGNVSPSPAR